MELHLDDWIQQNLYFLNAYEEDELNFVSKKVKEGDTFVDIGANIGLFTLQASKQVGNSGQVIAFEPFTSNFNLLQKNCSLNKYTNVVLNKLAVSENKSKIAIHYNASDANLGMASSYTTDFTNTEMVSAISLDEYLHEKNISKVHFIKLDIEGGEYLALLGMKKTLQHHKPILLIEIEDSILKNTPFKASDIIDFLEELGYMRYSLLSNGTLTVPENILNFNGNFIFINKEKIN